MAKEKRGISIRKEKNIMWNNMILYLETEGSEKLLRV